MSGKRSASSSQATSAKDEPPSKKPFVAIPSVNIGPVATEEELDIKVLKFQNSKLYAKLEEKNVLLEEQNAKVQELDRLRANDQAIISTLNVAWNQLDKDVLIMLERFSDCGEEENNCPMSDTTITFLDRLHNRTTKGIEEEIGKRVTFSNGIISQLIQFIDKRITRGKDIGKMLEEWSGLGAKKPKAEKDEKTANADVKMEIKVEGKTEEERKEEKESLKKEADEAGFAIASIELAIKQENAELKTENERLHNLVTSLHDRYNNMSSEFSDIHDRYSTSQREMSDLNTKFQDMQYDLQKSQHQVEKLIKRINEMTTAKGGQASVPSTPTAKSSGGGAAGGAVAGGAVASNPQLDDIKHELEEQRALAKSRLEELESLQTSHTAITTECEKLKLETLDVSDEGVLNSALYKTLQNQFTLLFAEAQHIRNQAEEAKKIIIANRTQHLMQMEQIEAEAQANRKKVRYEVSQLEKLLLESKRELELLRVEYEHNMKAHEQIGPMAKEMRHLINSLQNHNQQLKGEVMRYKRKLSEAQSRAHELEVKIKEIQEREKNQQQASAKASGSETAKDGTSTPLLPVLDTEKGGQDEASALEKERTPSPPLKGEANESETVKELKTKLKHAKESQKEMKLLLDMYKEVAKESRDVSELLQNEKQLKEEISSLHQKIEQLNRELQRKNQKSEDELHRRLKHADETISQLQKRLANTKQEEEALLAEMEFTQQAFEEMQEQNIRLMQQLREKDDSNLKLMSERIKANQVQKLLREEKEVLQEQINAVSSRHQSAEEILKRLEEREKTLQSAVQSMEKEIGLRVQAGEMHKRKALETTQQAAELTFKLDSVNKQLGESKEALIEKNTRLEEESFKCRRAFEENASLQRKVEKLKRVEYLGYSDEILVEEVKMYKAKLNCPCCNTRRKDAVITKCFHVFCMECLKTRYDTRQRKCPKCNAAFGNNDFRKIYM
ncbi:E3 ubiquitin-protein ligase Bre1-like [Rhopilema esculentum]|uniref:E3 ubiquitin-protein ligase Bre1-like n=1 Tax=Rhopilema esculentum TaxID=499914 RepID=UPI0031DFE97E